MNAWKMKENNASFIDQIVSNSQQTQMNSTVQVDRVGGARTNSVVWVQI